jgi:type I restriction enzyme M protein
MVKKKSFSDKGSTLNEFLPEEVRAHLESKKIKEISHGYIKDYVTGKLFPDTPEERVRQEIEHLLVDKLGYGKFEIDVEKEIEVSIGRRKFSPRADLVVRVGVSPIMVIETKAPEEDIAIYRDQAKSYAKVYKPPVPIVVLTNSIDTEVWNVPEDKLIAQSISGILPRDKASELLSKGFRSLENKEIEAALKTLVTFIDPKEFARVFDQCHDIIRTQRGLDARSRLYEMCKLILVKLYEEEREERREENRFSIRSIEKAERLGIDAATFINTSFEELKTRKLKGLFDPEEKIELKSHTIKEIVELLEIYSLRKTREDVLGVAFETFLRGMMTGKELGEFFTPREVVEFMVKLVDPQIGEIILDPACGTGGFLLWSFFYVLDKIKRNVNSEDERKKLEEKLVEECLWGFDIDSYLEKLCKINLKIHGDGYKHIYRANSLDLINDPVEEEHKEVRIAIKEILEKRGGFDIILTNPPFGSGPGKDITEAKILEKYENGKEGENVKKRQIPQILFLELCIRLLRPGGRMAIVIPDGILNNAGKDYKKIRDFIRRHTIIKAIIDLPPGTFRPYGSNVKASILYIQKKINQEEKQGDVFAAIVNEVGYDRRLEKYVKIPQNDLPYVLKEFLKWRMKG